MNYCNPEGFRNVAKENREEGKDRFFCWFDGPRGGDTDGAFEKAEDVFTRLMLPSAKKYVKKLNTKVSLDVGHGSGGQVLTASLYFDKCYGVDVHEENDLVLDELLKRGVEEEDINLLVGDGSSFPVTDSCVDFVHSWVTFMHLGTVEVTRKNLEEVFRVLHPGGVAVIYFSRLLRRAKSQTWQQVLEDIELEKEGPGYREGGPLTKVRGINIQMTMWYMEDLCKDIGFELLDRTGSWDQSGRHKSFFGQYGIVLRKPGIESVISKPRVKRSSGKK